MTSSVCGSMNTSKSSSPALRVVRQRSVGEAEPSASFRTADAVEDNRQPFKDQNPRWRMRTATTVPTATGACRGNVSTQPMSNCFHAMSAARARSKSALPRPIATIASSRPVADRLGSDDSDRAVRQRQVLRVTKEAVDCFRRRASGQEHEISQADTGLPNSASRTNSSTEITNRRTGGTRSASAAEGRSCCVSDTSAAVARWFELLSSSHQSSTAR